MQCIHRYPHGVDEHIAGYQPLLELGIVRRKMSSETELFELYTFSACRHACKESLSLFLTGP